MEAGVACYAGKSGNAVFVVSFVEDGAADLFEVELELFGEDVFDEGFDSDIVVATHGCEVGVGI